jgi:hypothetical protein
LFIGRVYFVASSHSPIALVENEDFMEFVKSLNSKYGLPCRKKLRDLILEEYAKIKDEV